MDIRENRLQQAQESYNEIMKIITPFLPKTENAQRPKPKIWAESKSDFSQNTRY